MWRNEEVRLLEGAAPFTARRAAAPVVVHTQGHVVRGTRQCDGHVLGLCVAAHIGQGFLRGAIQRQAQTRGQRRIALHGLERRRGRLGQSRDDDG